MKSVQDAVAMYHIRKVISNSYFVSDGFNVFASNFSLFCVFIWYYIVFLIYHAVLFISVLCRHFRGLFAVLAVEEKFRSFLTLLCVLGFLIPLILFFPSLANFLECFSYPHQFILSQSLCVLKTAILNPPYCLFDMHWICIFLTHTHNSY